MTLLSKKRQWTIFIVLIVLIGGVYWSIQTVSNIPPKAFIRISGLKPADATIKVWASYAVSGEECESYSYDMFGKKAHRGGTFITFFTQNVAESDEQYEFRVPYSSYTDSKNCIVELRDIKVEAYNQFDTVGFAQLRIYQAGTEYYNKPRDLSSKIEANDCRARYYEDLKEWSSGLACSFYVDEKMRDKKSDLVEFNAYKVYFDFSQFSDETIIHYDILAGENYRSAPLDPQTGQ